jgi:hypothetical protein
MDQHQDVEAARTEVAAYAEERCDVELDPTLSGSVADEATTTSTSSPSELAPTTTVGG